MSDTSTVYRHVSIEPDGSKYVHRTIYTTLGYARNARANKCRNEKIHIESLTGEWVSVE